jgi:hypothetical protein
MYSYTQVCVLYYLAWARYQIFHSSHFVHYYVLLIRVLYQPIAKIPIIMLISTATLFNLNRNVSLPSKFF